jgi:hypothetical protein
MSYSKTDDSSNDSDFEDQLTEALNGKTNKTSLNPEEEEILQNLLKEQAERDSEKQALILRLRTLAQNRKKFAGVQDGGKKRTIRKKNRKGRRTTQRKNRTRIHKKARKSMKRKTSRRKYK